MTSGRGERVSSRDGTVGYVFRRQLRHPPERVWRSLTVPAEWEAWHSGCIEIFGGQGGFMEAEMAGGFSWRGDIIVWEPPTVLEYKMTATGQAHPHGGECSLVRFEIEPTAAGCTLVLRHTRLLPQTALRTGPGSHAFLDRLDAWLAGRPMPDWERRYLDVENLY